MPCAPSKSWLWPTPLVFFFQNGREYSLGNNNISNKRIMARKSNKAAKLQNIFAQTSMQCLCVSMELLSVLCTVNAIADMCLARKSERPMLKTSNWTSNNARPSDRQHFICAVRSPMRSLVLCPCRSAVIVACSRTSTIRTCRPQYMMAKMSKIRRRE
jgi:hypothetical protein